MPNYASTVVDQAREKENAVIEDYLSLKLDTTPACVVCTSKTIWYIPSLGWHSWYKFAQQMASKKQPLPL
jgi:hypothetical protein